MSDFLSQYWPHLATVGAVLTPLIPTLIKRTISDKNLLGKVEEVKVVAEKLSQKELNIAKNIANITNTTDKMKADMEIMKQGVECQMKQVSDQLLGFQKEDIYQKMLNGLDRIDHLNQILDAKDTQIEHMATVIKDIKKKIGD
jgi:methyl-accepting chemotaxis protein